jgi:hypothetical protein
VNKGEAVVGGSPVVLHRKGEWEGFSSSKIWIAIEQVEVSGEESKTESAIPIAAGKQTTYEREGAQCPTT